MEAAILLRNIHLGVYFPRLQQKTVLFAGSAAGGVAS